MEEKMQSIKAIMFLNFQSNLYFSFFKLLHILINLLILNYKGYRLQKQYMFRL